MKDMRTNAEQALEILGNEVWGRFADMVNATKAAEERSAREAERVYTKGKTLLVVRRK